MIDTECIEHKEYELEVISPIHIGSGESMRFDDCILTSNGRVCFIDQRKWRGVMATNKNLIKKWSDNLYNGDEGMTTTEWIRKNIPGLQKGDKGKLDEFIRSVTYASAKRSKAPTTNANKGEFQCQMKDVNGKPIIPGSTLKGVIHTSILFHELKTHQLEYAQQWNSIKSLIVDHAHNAHNVNSLKKDIHKVTERIETKAFGKIPYQKGDKEDDSLHSIMKGIQVSDAVMQDDDVKDTVILQKYDAFALEDDDGNRRIKRKPIPMHRECIPKGRRFRFNMTIDKEILAHGGISSLNEIWSWVKEFTDFGLELQKGVFGETYRTEFREIDDAAMVLGAGTGFLSKTVFCVLAPKLEEAQEYLRSMLQIEFPSHKHEGKDKFIAPRTLKLAVSNKSQIQIMGLAGVREVPVC